jgi:hypothetical protein
VLFSNDDVVTFINKNFEPVWESIRPVPIVRIDFGNGTVLNRTLHGNIATYVCTARGQALDILPGIYEPQTYLHSLNQFRLLHSYVVRAKDQGATCLKEYHEGQARALKENHAPPQFVNHAGLSKRMIEGGILAVLVSGKEAEQWNASAAKIRNSSDQAKSRSTNDIANWKVLAEDTRINESTRRLQIHEMLAAAGPVQPNAITKKLYKEVLHADLDDPYLGLGQTLFAGYPFAKEDVGAEHESK